mgnify:FL=1
MRKTVTKVLEDSYIGKITETWKESKIELDGRLLDAGGRLVSPKHRYRVAILPGWGVEIVERCFAALEAAHPGWYKDESCALCDPAELSAWVIKTLRRCGCSNDYLESAKTEYERWVTRDRSGRPIETADAYVLRRDWATRARCICGLTARECDMLMGHQNPTPYAARPDFTLSNVCFDLSAKLGRYIYSTSLTDHPRYSPRLVHHGEIFP